MDNEVTIEEMENEIIHFEFLEKSLRERVLSPGFPAKIRDNIIKSIEDGSFRSHMRANLRMVCSEDDVRFLYGRLTGDDGKREETVMKRLAPCMEHSLNDWKARMFNLGPVDALEIIANKLKDVGFSDEEIAKIKRDGKVVLTELKPGENIADKINELRKEGKLTDPVGPTVLNIKPDLGDLSDDCGDPHCTVHGKPSSRVDPSAFG